MLRINGYEVKDHRFPDNTFQLNGDLCGFLGEYSGETSMDKHFFRQQLAKNHDAVNIYWRYDCPEELFLIQCLVGHIRDRMGARPINLFMPYIPNARMDRTHDLVGEVNILKYFCRIINDMNFESVFVMDPHSDAAVNQLDRIIITPTYNIVKDIVDGEIGGLDYEYLFFPDDGAAKRYSKEYNFRPYFSGKKDRDWHTGTLKGLILENPMGIRRDNINFDKRVLIVDDICSRGGTFLLAANALKNFGFKHIGLYVTHLESTVFTGKLLDDDSPIEHIYCTSSLNHGEHKKITTINLTED